MTTEQKSIDAAMWVDGGNTHPVRITTDRQAEGVIVTLERRADRLGIELDNDSADALAHALTSEQSAVLPGEISLMISKGVDARTPPSVTIAVEIEGKGRADVTLDAAQFAHLLGGTVLQHPVEWRSE